MIKSNENPRGLQSEPVYPSSPSEEDIRRRISDLIDAGGVYPISVTGVRNIAKMMRITPVEAAKIIREETERLAGREVGQ